MSRARQARWFIGFLRFCAWLPLPVNHALGALLGLVYWPLAGRDRRVVRVNLDIAFPELSRAQRWWLTARFFVGLGQTVTELGPLWLWKRRRLLTLVREVRGSDLMTAALAQGRGVMVLCPHFGAWELMGLYWSAQQRITSLYQPPGHAEVAPFIRQARERLGAQLVPTDLSGVRALLAALKRNELAGILPDQDPGDAGGVFAPFFGLPANTMSLAGRLLHKSQAPVLFTVCERLSWGRGYRVHILPCPEGMHSGEEPMAAAALNAGVEACVRLNPAQYVWNYKRWRRQLDGSRVY